MSRPGQFLPTLQRLRLYEESLQLRTRDLRLREIRSEIYRLYGARLSMNTIWEWVSKIRHPLGNTNRFDARPSSTLAYLIGVWLGDGFSFRDKRTCKYGLNTVDDEFAKETGRRLAELLGRSKPYHPRWVECNRYWSVSAYSVLFHSFLQRPFDELIPYIEHCKNCVATFLKGFFDSEGSVSKRQVKAHNTDFGLLTYIQQLLQRYFGIEATGPHKSSKAGKRFCSPCNGKVYEIKKDVYYLYITVHSLRKFYEHVGFT